MLTSSPIFAALIGVFALSAVAPLLSSRLGRNAGYPLAAGLAAACIAIGWSTPDVLAGDEIALSIAWIPSLGIRFSLFLDGLSLFFSLLVLGMGSLVMAYSARYFDRGASVGRTYTLLMLFAGSMLGLVLAGDVMVLFVFWELTSITSFFLIGGGGSDRARKPAARALLVTGLGGLALFAALLLAGIAAGGFALSTILSDPSVIRDGPLGAAILALLLLGAFTKSAQLPFQFWLPGAMVAPTPISTYLHAATMVKAGIYLLLRLAPVFAGSPGWLYGLTFVGLATAVFGAALALKQYDLKALLAYSTVSQLGFIIALVGVGTFPALAAAVLHTIAHAAYKSTLFMVVGIVDRQAGSRDIRELSGLRAAMPTTAAVTALAALSMAGLPPLIGFVSKEEAFTAFLGAPGPGWLSPFLAATAVAASVLTFAYSARLFHGMFGAGGRRTQRGPRASLLAAPFVTTAAGLGFGLAVGVLDDFVNTAAAAASTAADAVHLALWHGLTPALWLTVVTVSLGAGLFVARTPVGRLTQAMQLPVGGAQAFDGVREAVVAFGQRVGDPFVTRSPARHLGWVMGAAVLATVTAGTAYTATGGMAPPPSPAPDWVATVLLAIALVGLARAGNRLTAVALLGIVGFIVAAVYVLLGAPDLALTQLLIETLTVALIVLVFRRLPEHFHPGSRVRRRTAMIAALGAGSLVAVGTYVLTGRRQLSDVGRYFLEAAPAEAGGDNVVNIILVEFRALDTLGEITVLAVAAIGIYALVRIGREDEQDEGTS